MPPDHRLLKSCWNHCSSPLVARSYSLAHHRSTFNVQLFRISLGLLQWTPSDHRPLTAGTVVLSCIDTDRTDLVFQCSTRLGFYYSDCSSKIQRRDVTSFYICHHSSPLLLFLSPRVVGRIWPYLLQRLSGVYLVFYSDLPVDKPPLLCFSSIPGSPISRQWPLSALGRLYWFSGFLNDDLVLVRSLSFFHSPT